jgi:ketosteroid isomerase-like protein
METRAADRTFIAEAPEAIPTSNKVEEGRIHELSEEWATALRERDIDGIMRHYANGVEVFGIISPLHYNGKEEHRKHWEEMVGGFNGPIGYEIKEFHVVAGDDIAYSSSLNRISGKRMNGKSDSNWIRVTVCYRKIEGEWLATHEHVSVPFDPGTLKAETRLEP